MFLELENMKIYATKIINKIIIINVKIISIIYEIRIYYLKFLQQKIKNNLIL